MNKSAASKNESEKKTQRSPTHSSGGGSEGTAESSNTSTCQDELANLRIEDVATFDLNKVEFLDKLGEGKCFILLKNDSQVPSVK